MRNYHKNSFKFFLWVLFFSLIFANKGICQYFLTGTDPASLKWRQIKTPNFKVIFPASFEKQAKYIANGLEYIYIPGSRTLQHLTFRMPVVIHNQTTIPSSVTYIAPRRMDFFTTSPQEIYPQDWVDQLIIHEFRHASQYSALNRGFTKGLSYILGEQATFGIYGLFLPIWFIEGDATLIETALHPTGRGRSPSFQMRLRAQMVDKGIYSYDKANYGSFHDFVPGKYELGYPIVATARDIFGSMTWSKVVENVGRRPWTLFPFSSGIRKETGFNKFGLYDTLTRKLQTGWLEQDKLIRENNYQVITKPVKDYTSYNLPVLFRDSLIISVKSSLDELTKVVLIDRKGNETMLFRTGINYYPESLSATDSIIYWTELVNDPRWSLGDYRVIKSYNVNSGKLAQLTHRTRYYAPSVSNDGKNLVAVEISTENVFSLAILDPLTGSVIKKIGSPENLFFIHPQWSDDNKSIAAMVVGKQGTSIAIINAETGYIETLLPWSWMELKRPFFYKNNIIYMASYNGTDNIYAFNRDTKEVFKITSARFGAYDARISEKEASLIYSNYTADGYKIVKEQLNPTKWQKIAIPEVSAFPLAEKMKLQENFTFIPDSVPKINYTSKPYNKLLHLFNFHSWIPFGIDIQNFSAAPGITMMSQNVLGSSITTLGYLYNKNECNGKYFFSMSTDNFYPGFDLNISYGDRKDILIDNRHNYVPEKWNEFNLSAGLRLPLNWTHNAWKRSFTSSINLNYKNLDLPEQSQYEFEHDRLATMNYSLLASNSLKTSLRDIYPRWSQTIQFNYSNAPFNNTHNSIIAGQVTLDFPGIGRHHGIQLYGRFQKKDETFYPFSDYIILPRGHSQIFRDEISGFSVMYTMPLCYPDRRIGHILYFKRLKTSIFYDYAGFSDNISPRSISSVGFDLTSDFSLLNLIAPVDAGIRTIYMPETRKMKFEFLFALNFGAMY